MTIISKKNIMTDMIFKQKQKRIDEGAQKREYSLPYSEKICPRGNHNVEHDCSQI